MERVSSVDRRVAHFSGGGILPRGFFSAVKETWDAPHLGLFQMWAPEQMASEGFDWVARQRLSSQLKDRNQNLMLPTVVVPTLRLRSGQAISKPAKCGASHICFFASKNHQAQDSL
jgi:hypothetical protein